MSGASSSLEPPSSELDMGSTWVRPSIPPVRVGITLGAARAVESGAAPVCAQAPLRSEGRGESRSPPQLGEAPM